MELRFGTADDVDKVIDYILEAGAGTFEFLLTGIIITLSTRDLLRFSVTDEGSPYHFSNAVLAEEDGVVHGMILSLPSEDLGMSGIVKKMIPKDRQQILSKLTDSVDAGSWYINTLVVEKAAQGLGVGRKLLAFSANIASRLDRDALTLHVWSNNEQAMNLYQSLGFKEIDRFQLDLSRRGYQCSDMVLMRAKLPLHAI
jgi:ribosomal protein S18 acetylase RimI-like enzyme